METFDQWWVRVGHGLWRLSENCSEVARAAFEAAKAQSRNYVADDEEYPERITFANGRVVRLTGDGYYLSVEQL